MTVWIEQLAEPRRGADDGPLAGRRVAVKDNVDVAGVPTTAGCPSFAYTPEANATAVDRLLAAGATVVGKTNLDQFATGLVGTRSPYGVVANPLAPGLIAGGSSSGSAAAVALGEVDLAIGTDTAGSGRVPAACCGVVGIKPTIGWVSTAGVVPACPSFDCTTLFARTIADAAAGVVAMAGPDGADPRSRRRPDDLAFGDVRRIGVLSAADLARCDTRVREGLRFAALVARDAGFETVEIDIAAYLEAGRLLYGGAFVAERFASVGHHVAAGADDLDPTVASIIGQAASATAADLAVDTDRLAVLRSEAARVWDLVDAVMLPTIPSHPTLAQVDADPIGVNGALGEFVSGCNLVDWCGVAVPFENGGPVPVGVQLLGPAWSDDVIWRAAARLIGEAPPRRLEPRFDVAVVGAHLDGYPLNRQLTDRGGTLVSKTSTAPVYRMFALPGEIAKPGMLRVAEGGDSVEVEVWSLTPAAFGSFVDEVPPPLAIGSLELVDGSIVNGFVCEPEGVAGATDITEYGGWRRWCER
ncbi:MAG: allophanate hydrolase [Actinomycetota bacterium]